jgi:fluoroacetyl-CoA thioesterase
MTERRSSAKTSAKSPPVRSATATLDRVEGRRLTFNVSVNDHCGLVAAGKVTRVVVERDRFLDKAR